MALATTRPRAAVSHSKPVVCLLQRSMRPAHHPVVPTPARPTSGDGPDSTPSSGPKGHQSFLAAASTGRTEQLARRALPDERSPPRSALRPLSAIRAAAGRIAEAATGVILLRADGEDELADRNRGRSASYQMACAAVPQVNRQPLAWPSSELGSVAISGTGYLASQVNAFCHTAGRGPGLRSSQRPSSRRCLTRRWRSRWCSARSRLRAPWTRSNSRTSA